MPHTREEWQPWGAGFPLKMRQIVAKDVTKTSLVVVVLPPGGGKRPIPGDLDQRPVNVRARLKDFECLVEGCGPFEGVVAGDERRHHFRHSTAASGRPGHEPESVDHLNAKHVLADWLRSQLGPCLERIFIDEHRVATPTGTFEPDVYAELDTGAKIAVEYQHSPGDPATVERKVMGYAKAKIACWWLFGPYNRTCRKLKEPLSDVDRQARYSPSPVQQNLIERGVAFHWFTAEHVLIGTPLVVRRRDIAPIRPNEDWGVAHPRTERSYPQRPWRGTTWVLLDGNRLDDCRINIETGQLETPTEQRIRSLWVRGDREIATLRANARSRHAERLIAEAARLEAPTNSVMADEPGAAPVTNHTRLADEPPPVDWSEAVRRPPAISEEIPTPTEPSTGQPHEQAPSEMPAEVKAGRVQRWLRRLRLPWTK